MSGEFGAARNGANRITTTGAAESPPQPAFSGGPRGGGFRRPQGGGGLSRERLCQRLNCVKDVARAGGGGHISETLIRNRREHVRPPIES